MVNSWKKLISREGVDITSISGIDKTFFESIWNFTGKKEEVFFTYLKNKKFTHYTTVDFQDMGRQLYKKYFPNKEKTIAWYEVGREILKNSNENSSKWKERIKENSSRENLLESYKVCSREFIEVCDTFSIGIWIAIEAWQIDFNQIVSSLIKKNNLEDNQEKILATLSKLWKKTALIEIAEKLRNGESPEKLAEEYQFIRDWALIWYKPIDKNWFDTIKSSKGREIETISQKEAIELLKPNSEEKKFLELSKYIIFFKDWRDDLRRHQVYNWSFLFDAIAKKFNIERQDLGYLTIEEIEECLKKEKIDHSLIKLRKDNPCVITAKIPKLTMEVLSKKDIEKYEEILKQIDLNSSSETSKMSEVKGLIANKGIVKGKVIIIQTHHDIKKVKPGDILVANTTHPNYLPAMQVAAAFITNEGGIISHAAIVARELNKPCIVGTKTATKILKDGDIIEVNANQGIVKILERK